MRSSLTVILAALLILVGGCVSFTHTGEERRGVSVTDVEAPDIDLDALAGSIQQKVNERREAHGLAPYDGDVDLTDLAESHSVDMATHAYFSHYDSEGNSVSERAEDAGLNCLRRVDERTYELGFGENLFKGSHYESFALSYRRSGDGVIRPQPDVQWRSKEEFGQKTVDAWMESDGHRENILSDQFSEQGIAVKRSDRHVLYVTQVLC